MYEAYRMRLGDYPCKEEDITPEQLTGLDLLFRTDGAPYVDLAVWGPYGRRLAKRIKLSGMVTGPGGTLRPLELSGPPSYGTGKPRPRRPGREPSGSSSSRLRCATCGSDTSNSMPSSMGRRCGTSSTKRRPGPGWNTFHV